MAQISLSCNLQIVGLCHYFVVVGESVKSHNASFYSGQLPLSKHAEMPVSVRQTTNEDAEELAHIWLHSLEDNDMVKLASREGITPERLAGATRKTREDLDDPNALCLTAYDSETRAVMGCAVWRYFPNGKPLPVDVPPGTDKDESSGQREGNAKGTTVYPSISKDLEEASNKIFMKHVGRRPHACRR